MQKKLDKDLKGQCLRGHATLFPRAAVVFSSLPKIVVMGDCTEIAMDQGYRGLCFKSHGNKKYIETRISWILLDNHMRGLRLWIQGTKKGCGFNFAQGDGVMPIFLG